MKSELLEVKKTLKKRRPSFTREGYHKKIATKKNWRQPRGNRSKVKLERRGRRRRPKVGYGSPSELRGLTKDGFQIVIVENLDAMKKINPKLQVALIGSGVGLKKRVEMLEIAKANKIVIYNYKNAEKSIHEKLKKIEEKRKKVIKKKKVSKKEEKEQETTEKKADLKKEEVKKADLKKRDTEKEEIKKADLKKIDIKREEVEKTDLKKEVKEELLEKKKKEEKKEKDKVLIKAR